MTEPRRAMPSAEQWAASMEALRTVMQSWWDAARETVLSLSPLVEAYQRGSVAEQWRFHAELDGTDDTCADIEKRFTSADIVSHIDAALVDYTDELAAAEQRRADLMRTRRPR